MTQNPTSGLTVVFYQPDIAANVGAAIRLCACLNVRFEVIGPCGFPFSSKSLRRAAMDYGDANTLAYHTSWEAFGAESQSGRLVLLTTSGATPLPDFRFQPGDSLLFGAEGRGVPEAVHAAADARVVIPITGRSLNLVTAAAIAGWEAIRQIRFHVPTDS